MTRDAIRGPLWLLASGLFVTAVVVFARLAAQQVPTLEVVFFRNVFCLVFMLPAFFHAGLAALRTRRIGTHAARAVVGLLSTVCWFLAVNVMPIADVTALTFLTPIFATMGAALFLGEVVRARRWAATLVGFAGALIVVRPGFQHVGPEVLIALGAAVFMAASMLYVKSLSSTESATTILVLQMLFQIPASAVPAAFVWQAPPLEAWWLLVATGFSGALGQVLMVRAFAAAEASAILPFDYARLIYAALFGFALFGEVPDAWTWVGATVIFAAALYVVKREAQLKTGVTPRVET